MAVTVVAGSAVGSASSTSISKPSGYTDTAGDLIVVQCESSNLSGITAAPTPPSGFTTIATLVNTAGATTWAYKVDSGSETWPKSYTASANSNFDVWSCIVLRGQDSTTPLDGTATTAQITSGSSLSLAAITASVAGDALVILLNDVNDVDVSTWPSGVSEYAASSNPTGNGVATGTKTGLASGSTGTLAVTLGANPGLTQACAILVKAAASGGSTVSGGATEQANAAISAAGQLVAPATVQSNAALAEASAHLLASANVQANAGISAAGQMVAPATVTANAGLSVAATILQAPVPVQANAVLSEASAQLLAPASVQANAVLAASGGVVGKVEGTATVAASAAMTVSARILAPSLTPLQANATLTATAQVTQPSITAQANAALTQSGASVLAPAAMQANAALSEAQAILLALATVQANAALSATGHIPLPAGYKSPVGSTARRTTGRLTGGTVLRVAVSAASATTARHSGILTGSTAKE